MESWIAITLGAAFVQNLRFMAQKTLRARLSTLAVTFARFLYGAPLAWAAAAALAARPGQGWPSLSPGFWAHAGAGAVAQILATALLVTLFTLRNFAVGVTFSKTETVATGLLSAAILAEPVTGHGWAAIALTVAGVVAMSGPPARAATVDGLFSRAAGIGIAAGVLFAVASIGYRGATLALEGGDAATRGAVTLALVTTLQTALMAAWLAWRAPGDLLAVLRAWPAAGLVGVLSVLGSLGWFIAFALHNAAEVKALGQVEVAFTVAASVLWFRERLRWFEALGIVLVGAGVLVLILG